MDRLKYHLNTIKLYVFYHFLQSFGKQIGFVLADTASVAEQLRAPLVL